MDSLPAATLTSEEQPGMNDRIAPTGPDPVGVRIVSVPENVPLVALFCGRLQGLLTHRHGKQTFGCEGEGVCPPSTHKERSVWKGYAPGRYYSTVRRAWIPGVLEVTEHLDELLRERDYVGEVWTLLRESPGKKNGPVSGFFMERRTEPELLAPFDVRPPLFLLYHSTRLALGVANPIPPKLRLPTVAAAAPAGLAELLPSAPTPDDPKKREEAMRQFRRFRDEQTHGNGRK